MGFSSFQHFFVAVVLTNSRKLKEFATIKMEEGVHSPGAIPIIEEVTDFGVVNIAVQGCCHGELDIIYQNIIDVETSTGTKVDLLLICGDFECVRDVVDLCCMAVPFKYRHLKNFYKYFNGECQAPVKTIFIGGNHEASNVLQSLYYGGYVAPNIYFLGWAAVVNFKGLRIGGMSGIYNDKHYTHGHFERPPYTDNTMRSIYHIRAYEVQQMMHFPSPDSSIKTSNRNVDIFLTHDWPSGIWSHGDVDTLLRIKPYFRKDIENGELGSVPARQLLDHLKPSFWFAGHMHVKFAAIVPHASPSSEPVRTTRFLALDKVIPGRGYMQFMQFPIQPSNSIDNVAGQIPIYQDDELHFDVEWCTILRKTHHEMGKTRFLYHEAPSPVNAVDMEETRALLEQEYGSTLIIPMTPLSAHSNTEESFCAICQPPVVPIPQPLTNVQRLQEGNPQTDRFLTCLRLPHVWTIPYGSVAQNGQRPHRLHQEEEKRPQSSNSTQSFVPSQVRLHQQRENSSVPRPPPPPPPSIPHPTELGFQANVDPNELDI